MSEFWLISAPGDKENLQALERMNTVTSKSNLSYNTKFSIPDFKVGTLDSLVGLSDELGKLDTFAESLIKRMAQSVVEVMEDSKGKVPENLLANGGLKEKLKCLKIDLTSFVTHFEWDMAKYPAKQPLVSVVDTLAKQLAQIETDLKSRTAAYNTLKTNLENLEKKSMGNLFTRTLSDIVSKEDFVLDSEYLVTLLVIVPKPSYTQWQKTYESLSDMVVPRSTKLIAEDNEGGLFTVTLFRKVIDDFKTKAKENKFTVREFYYDEKEIKREREELSRLLSDKKQQYQTSCVALKKGSSTFPDHKVQVTPLGNPDRPAAGQTDRERESEGEGEVSSTREPWASPARMSSPVQASSEKTKPCVFWYRRWLLGAQIKEPSIKRLSSSSGGPPWSCPPAPGSGWCLLARVPPPCLEVAGAGDGDRCWWSGGSALLPWLPWLDPPLTLVGTWRCLCSKTRGSLPLSSGHSGISGSCRGRVRRAPRRAPWKRRLVDDARTPGQRLPGRRAPSQHSVRGKPAGCLLTALRSGAAQPLQPGLGWPRAHAPGGWPAALPRPPPPPPPPPRGGPADGVPALVRPPRCFRWPPGISSPLGACSVKTHLLLGLAWAERPAGVTGSPVSAGPAAALAQGELQRSLHCLDPHQGPEGVCGVRAQIGIQENRG
ncbi:V-type proton ATPase subunit C 2 isoform X10 [Leopardus geoffroyi]|uniref:V-type proton ATPase subunit C 2 isoform X10 n=1 Tax=Leopardus geoffroyi TaxID=46844 RepID=UPI001E25F1B3|nr:V-type proton ATPase subunit C 2 isoform X10 [Leopardus geoffroyi]